MGLVVQSFNANNNKEDDSNIINTLNEVKNEIVIRSSYPTLDRSSRYRKCVLQIKGQKNSLL